MEGRKFIQASILVIDDEAVVHESCRRVLEDEGYRVDGAFSLKEGIAALEMEPFEVVVTDLKMPGGSGMDVIRSIRDRWEDTAVIMITGYSTVDSAVEAMKLGAVHYLPKPFTPEELADAVLRAMEQRRLAIEERQLRMTFEEATRGMRSSRDLDEVLGLIVEAVVKLTEAKGSTVFLLDPRHARWELRASAGLSQTYLEKGLVEVSRSLSETLEGKRVWIQDVSADPRVQYPEEAMEEGIRSILSVPMTAKGEVIGCLRVYSDRSTEFLQAENELLDRFTQQAAIAVHRARSFHEMEKDIQGLRNGLPKHMRDRPRPKG
jgi:ActR/RegA family two-component response regulator